jgi:hypothetical protein
MDHDITMQEVVECVHISGVTGDQSEGKTDEGCFTPHGLKSAPRRPEK